ncbi:FAD/NAD-binding domain-containing protein [Favolaschia claudopus]|uniref:FAD/NAD-binding domain-containing protein n=1 Tax=Favolaschia claudopus TaxID=2862362 RepID=A0AAW0CMU3_9AGAR
MTCAAQLRLNVVIVGCGIGGLAAAYCLGRAGHKITVLERASEITEIGAGIQVGPNCSRLLIRWGLGDKLEKVAVKPTAVALLRYGTGEKVGAMSWENVEEDFGAPYYHVHRADLLGMLHGIAAPYMSVRMNAKVVSVDPETTQVKLENGDTVSADLIIGADGIKSVVREVVVESPSDNPTTSAPIHTGDSAYRSVIQTAAMLTDPELRGIVERREMSSWMGPGKHIIGYCIRGGTEYNLVLVHPDKTSKEGYTIEGSVDQMRKDYEDWEPRIQKILQLVEKTYLLPLMYREPLDTWVHPSGKVTLLGDACHATLPSAAQGSAMASLGSLLTHVTHHTQLHKLLRAYQTIRHGRTKETQCAAFANHHIFHLPDGPAQQARDDNLRASMMASEKNGSGAAKWNANSWADRKKLETQFNYDAEAEAERWLVENDF